MELTAAVIDDGEHAGVCVDVSRATNDSSELSGRIDDGRPPTPSQHSNIRSRVVQREAHERHERAREDGESTDHLESNRRPRHRV